MRSPPERHSGEAEQIVRDIRRAVRRQYSAEEKVRIVIAPLWVCNCTVDREGWALPGPGFVAVVRRDYVRFGRLVRPLSRGRVNKRG